MKSEVLGRTLKRDVFGEIEISRGLVWYYAYESDTLRSSYSMCDLVAKIKLHIVKKHFNLIISFSGTDVLVESGGFMARDIKEEGAIVRLAEQMIEAEAY